VILGASFDTVEENRAFAEKFGFPFRLLCDTKREIGMAYGACATPRDGSAKRISYVIDPQGLIAHAFPKVDAKSHPKAVLELLA
jgi:peroxiredoxin Q/BCP